MIPKEKLAVSSRQGNYVIGIQLSRDAIVIKRFLNAGRRCFQECRDVDVHSLLRFRERATGLC